MNVRIRRQWNDWRIGEVAINQITGLHWSRVSGGVMATAPQYFVHGYVTCTDVKGEIAHSRAHGPCPHNIKVCVVKKDNAEVWGTLVALAGEKPNLHRHKTRVEAPLIVQAIVRGGIHPCISQVRDLAVINPKQLFSDSSSKRLKNRITKLMSPYTDFIETRYRSMLAYRLRSPQHERTIEPPASAGRQAESV